MLRILKEFLDTLAPASAPETPAGAEHKVQLATAVLLVEVMRADPESSDRERAAALDALRRAFSLPPDELDALLALAQQQSEDANDFFAFTSALNDSLTHREKIDVVERMWQVAFADGALDAGENHVISKVAGLLHVTHGEYIAAKLHAREATRPGA